MLFDTHCHLGYEAEDAVVVRARAAAAGVGRLVDVGIDAASTRRARDRARNLADVRWSAGLHPNDASRLEAEWAEIAAMAAEPDCVAVGETGLDYYRDRTPPDLQKVSFERHLVLAAELGKPVIVHCRDAFDDVFAILGAHRHVRAVLHCFSGGPEEMRRAQELDLYVSFAGPLTYPKSEALRAAARIASHDRVVVETDAPFLPPQDWRGKRNEPAYVVRTAERLAAERGVSFDAIAATTTANASRLFGWD